jgi:3-methyladenine DNA glycosylase/8-oxoguanine DNA glycosylase
MMSRNQGQPSPADLRALSRRDPVLGRAMKRLPPFPGFGNGRSADSHFHSLARTIIYQQLAGRAAATIHDRVHALTPGPRFPRAEDLAKIPNARLKKAGLSGAKQAAIKDLARKVIGRELRLQSISRLDDQDIIERLTTVRGIGPWSAQMFLIFRLGRLDVLPGGDLGVQEGLRILDGLDDRPTQAELESRGACWAPLRSVATWTLYRVVDEARDA